MGRFFSILAIAVIAAMALVAAAACPDHDEHHEVEHLPFIPVSHAETDEPVQYLGKFAVERYDEQTHACLKFIQVMEAVLDRGTEHYTYHLLMKVHDGYDFKLYRCEVFQDLSGSYEESPVLNIGYFEPL